MNASVAPVAVPVVLSVLHLSLVELPAPSVNVGFAPTGHELDAASSPEIGAQERHVQSWRASLGHAYAEWARSVPGDR